MPLPFDRYPVIAADLIRDHGPAALPLVAEEHRQATIAGDADGAAFWGLVRARVGVKCFTKVVEN